MKFTDRGVRNLQPTDKRFEVWEARGLGLRVAPSGLRTWIFLYRFNGKPRRVCLGRYPRLSVAQAHRAHGVAAAQLADGIDPGTLRVREKKSEREAPTIATLAKDYIDKHARPKKRSWKADDATLRRDVLPVWGDRKAKDIRRRDVIDLLDGIVLRGAPIAANRTFAMVRRMFSWAIERDMLEHSPCTHVRRPAPEHRRDRVLSSAELAKLWPVLSEASVDDPVRLSLAFMLTTAQRLGEILSARWEDVDLALAFGRFLQRSRRTDSHTVFRSLPSPIGCSPGRVSPGRPPSGCSRALGNPTKTRLARTSTLRSNGTRRGDGYSETSRPSSSNRSRRTICGERPPRK